MMRLPERGSCGPDHILTTDDTESPEISHHRMDSLSAKSLVSTTKRDQLARAITASSGLRIRSVPFLGEGFRAVVTHYLGSTTLIYMSSQPIRIESETLRALRERSRLSGEPIVRLAQRYIDEGMRLDRHPGIIFRDGPAGRRAVVVGGPDVWEVVVAARSAPERGDELVEALAARIGVPDERIRIAIRYYAEYPEEVDDFIAQVEEEAERLEEALERERSLLE